MGKFPHRPHQLHHHCLVLFIVVKVMNQIIHSEPQAPPLSKQEMLITEIRDLLKRPRPINGDTDHEFHKTAKVFTDSSFLPSA